jgi:hypothetical protein
VLSLIAKAADERPGSAADVRATFSRLLEL